MYQTSDIRKGIKIEMDGYPWEVVDFQFVKPGKGTAFTRTRMKNLIQGNVIERSFRTGEQLEQADVVQIKMQYMYKAGDAYNFMNLETFDSMEIDGKVLGDSAKWLLEQMEVQVLLYKERPVSIELPNFVELEITYTEPGVRGNTAQGTTKSATLSTGAEIQVPLFVDSGTIVKIDTRTGEYMGRVN